jgi:ribosome-associated translation inhibitor RaiA
VAILKVSSEVRIGKGFQQKLHRDMQKIEEMSPQNALLRVVLHRSENGLFETEMESVGFSKRLFSKAQASNAFAAFKICRDALIKQIRRQTSRRRSLHERLARENKRSLHWAKEMQTT